VDDHRRNGSRRPSPAAPRHRVPLEPPHLTSAPCSSAASANPTASMEVEVNGCAPIGGEKATGAGDNGDIGFAFGGGAEEARNWVEKYDDSPRCLLSSISWRDTGDTPGHAAGKRNSLRLFLRTRRDVQQVDTINL